MIDDGRDRSEFFGYGKGVWGQTRRGDLVEGMFDSCDCDCATTLVGGGVAPGVGGCRSGGMRWGSSAAVGTIFDPG